MKILLANQATKILHGDSASKKAEQTARQTFKSGGLSLDLPEIKISFADIRKGVNLLDFLSENKIMSSKSEARRAIIGKGLRINDKIVDNDKKVLQQIDFKEKIAKVSYGKKKHYIVKII